MNQSVIYLCGLHYVFHVNILIRLTIFTPYLVLLQYTTSIPELHTFLNSTTSCSYIVVSCIPVSVKEFVLTMKYFTQVLQF